MKKESLHKEEIEQAYTDSIAYKNDYHEMVAVRFETKEDYEKFVELIDRPDLFFLKKKSTAIWYSKSEDSKTPLDVFF